MGRAKKLEINNATFSAFIVSGKRDCKLRDGMAVSLLVPIQ